MHIPKAAGTTITTMLRRTFGVRHIDVEPWHGYSHRPFSAKDFRKLYKINPLLVSLAGHTVSPVSDLDDVVDVRYFSYLRDPLTRTASHYQYQHQRMGVKEPLSDWLNAPSHRNVQVGLLSKQGTAAEAIDEIRRRNMFIGLVEKFDESHAWLERWMGHRLALPRRDRNVASDSSIHRSLLEDDSAMRLITASNDQDLLLYEYVTSEWLPSYASEWPLALPESSHDSALLADDAREAANRVVRNVVYKPSLRIVRRLSRASIATAIEDGR